MNGNDVTVDQTILYAFSGGQESDEGTIGGKRVLQAKKDGKIVNMAETSPAISPLSPLPSPLYVIVDRLAAGSPSDSRLRDSLETAFAKGAGRCYVFVEEQNASSTNDPRVDFTSSGLYGIAKAYYSAIYFWSSSKAKAALASYISDAKTKIVMAEEIMLSPYLTKVYEVIRN